LRQPDGRSPKPITPGPAGYLLTSITLGVTIASGLLVHWLDRASFPNVGIWWAAQTVATVGYGDIRAHGHNRSADHLNRDDQRHRFHYRDDCSADVLLYQQEDPAGQAGIRRHRGQADQLSSRIDAIDTTLEDIRTAILTDH
jgi:Ion channel